MRAQGLLFGAIVVLCAASAPRPASGDYKVTISQTDSRTVWEGWGCSLAWWAKRIGGSPNEHLYDDAFFTTKSVPFLNQNIPGLGLNIIRYNIGGSGLSGVNGGTAELVSPRIGWDRQIEGFWRDPIPGRTTPTGWDWSRDANQRSVLAGALARGVDRVELWSDAPMWWMTDNRSADGGKLLPDANKTFAHYLAITARHFRQICGSKLKGIEPFNEPAAWWWKYPSSQECCAISVPQQEVILGDLRQELDNSGLRNFPIFASDENSIPAAKSTFSQFQQSVVPDQLLPVTHLVNRVCVHGYSGLAPFRNTAARADFKTQIGSKPLWMSEYGDGDGGGMVIAQQIMEDINYLRPSAWIYWQPVEEGSAWGFLNDKGGSAPDSVDRGTPSWVYWKYFSFAQFTRFLRPGDTIIGSSDNNTIVGYSQRRHQLTFITLNYNSSQSIHFDLQGIGLNANTVSVTKTNTAGPDIFKSYTLPVSNGSFTINAEPNTIYSTVIQGVSQPSLVK